MFTLITNSSKNEILDMESYVITNILLEGAAVESHLWSSEM